MTQKQLFLINQGNLINNNYIIFFFLINNANDLKALCTSSIKTDKK